MPTSSRRIVTLRDIGNSSVPNSLSSEGDSPFNSSVNAAVSATSSTNGQTSLPYDFCQPASVSTDASKANAKIPLHHIATLLLADECRQTLERIHKEFSPIIQRRGYNVKSISEMCCCGDGLDAIRRKNLRKQPENVWGYNQTAFFRSRGRPSKTSHTIHLRLRQPRHHTSQLLPWEDVAGTMAHELSHCVHQNHSEAFYKLMEEILDEHARLQVQSMGDLDYGGMGISNASIPAASVSKTREDNILSTVSGGQRLGGNQALDGKSRLLQNCDVPKMSRGYILDSASAGVVPRSIKGRREMLAQRAEQRIKQMKQLRRMIEKSKEPCVIEVMDDSDDESTNSVIKQKSKRGTTEFPEIVDLLSSPIVGQKKPRRYASKETIDLTSPVDVGRKDGYFGSTGSWSCSRCTLQNRSDSLICAACNSKKCNLNNFHEANAINDTIFID